MTDKPSYLGMLNRIAVGEAGGERFLEAWAESCQRDDVRGVLQTIALREGEHAKAFAKRMCELGFTVKGHDDPSMAERMKIVSSKSLSDREKFEKLGIVRTDAAEGILGKLFEDTTIDAQTGALLGRFIAEERDSLRMFKACYDALCAEDASNGKRGNGHRGNGATSVDERLDRIEAAVDKLTRSLAPKRKR